ncbi:hypothetical protein QFC22_001972 [Naganishia vaughanmartiniae]|uniref:Uncharacterized protein n=1 Tax=Naganishia vaughanmartiniae TaxID=1424756 RepID=A0ACC2XES8_9TREE|nr:hypothetical protein QFC22_001972 [Naganishia vaughanmartiniae]
MDQPINTNSESVEALLARLRQAQERTNQDPGPSQNGNHYQYQPNINPYEQPQYNGDSHGFSSSIVTPTSDPSFGQAYAQQQQQYDQHPTFYNDRLQYQEHYQAPALQHGPTPAYSVNSLLTSLQSSRQGGYPGPVPPIPPPPQYGFVQPDIGSRQTPTGWNRSKYAPQRQQQQSQTNGHDGRNSANSNLPANPTVSSFNTEPLHRRIQPSVSPSGLPNKSEKQRSPIAYTREPVVEPPRKVPKIATPPTPVAPIVSTPVQPAQYDPYNEDYEEATVPEDAPQAFEELSDVEHDTSGDEEEQVKTTEEEEHARVIAQRNTDEFVNLSYGQALPIITRLLNEDTVMQRLRELKEEQDRMERQLWEKRLEIVKVYRERIENAKADAVRQDEKTGNSLIQKERSAASRALKQYYITRCLPHFDDLHRKHLKIMQEELGIPGLGRPETRRRIPVTMSGRAERPISVDSDDEEGGGEEETMNPGDVELAEEEKQKMLARRRKIMSVIESVMSDA